MNEKRNYYFINMIDSENISEEQLERLNSKVFE